MSPPAAAAKAMFSDDESGSDSGSDTSGSSSGSDDTAKRRASKPNSNVVGKAGDVLTINKKFAERFEHNKRREETHRLQEKVKREYILRPGDIGDSESDSETSSSESDEGDVPVKFDAQFAEALLKIKQKDPAIYREDAELFSSDDDDDDDDAKEKKKKKRAPKKETLREVTARQLLEGGAEAYEREDAEAEARRVQASGRSYVEEQEDLKNAFKTAAGLDVIRI
jgi:protein KRI1